MTKRICVPARFEETELDAYAEINAHCSHASIWELYGGLSPDPFGSGRAPQTLPRVSPNRLIEYVNECRRRGFRFNYVFNASCIGGREFTTAGRDELLRYVEAIVACGVSSITLAVPAVIELVAKYFPELDITASAILRIDTPSKARAYVELGARRLILFEDVNRDFRMLDAIRAAVDAELEIMVNSPCVFGCAFREYHYNVQAHSHNDLDIFGPADAWFNRCNLLKLTNPEELVRARGLVRPEDLHHYTTRGIQYFKIVGREAMMNNTLRVASAYAKGAFDGNIFDLLPRSVDMVQAYTLSNRVLDGFIEHFAAELAPCSTGCIDCGYCDSFAKLMTPGVSSESLQQTIDQLSHRVQIK